jgi:coenzyme F420 hydrogenase subunit beta
MAFQALSEEILSKGLCTSCGICEVVCPKKIIEMDELHPKLKGTSAYDTCGDCQECVTVCPGKETSVQVSETKIFGRVRAAEERWLGIYKYAFSGHSNIEDVFRVSSSGGCSTTLLLAAMESMNLDFVLVAGRDAVSPWKATSIVCRNQEDLLASTQSTYQLFPHLRILKDVLEKNPKARIGMSALPCQVQAIRKLQQMDSLAGEFARNNILFILEVACSSSTKVQGTETFVEEKMNIELSKITDLKYRAGEYPGNMAVHTKDNVHEGAFWELVRHLKSFKTHRCLSCGDWMSGLADVSVCDGDPNIFASSVDKDDPIQKHGRILVRTEAGLNALEYSHEKNWITTWGTDLGGFNLGLERKRNRRAFYERSDKPIPDSPIPGYVEDIEIIPDEKLIAIPEKKKENA